MNNLGKLAELKSIMYLKENKYKILDFNYSCRFGEIDIIAKKKKYIVFIEVKMRNENSIAQPREFVDDSKQRKIIATSGLYLSTHPSKLQPRFDVIEVIFSGDEIKSIKHLENAFTLV